MVRPRAGARKYRNWKPVIERMIAGSLVWLPDSALTERQVKHVSERVGRMGHSLRTGRRHHGQVPGRLLWIEPRGVHLHRAEGMHFPRERYLHEVHDPSELQETG